jgi:hypothetical protein
MAATAHQVKQVTLTSKKNWWCSWVISPSEWSVSCTDQEDLPVVQAGSDQDEPLESQHVGPASSFATAETAVSPSHAHGYTHAHEPNVHHHTTSSRLYHSQANPSVSSSPQLFKIPRHPSSIFSFPTPTTYAAPPNPTANIAPVAQGSASELFKCIVKKPEVVQLEINGVCAPSSS